MTRNHSSLPFLLIAFLTFALSLPALATDNSAVLGKWTMTLERQGQSFDVVLEFAEADGNLAGTWTAPNGTTDLTDPVFDGETLTFNRQISREGNEFTINFSAKIDGSSMTGTMSTPRGDQPISATKAD